MPGSISENIGDDPHRCFRRIDVRIADHEFLQDIILDGAAEFFELCPLLQSSDNIKGHYGQYRAVHGHGNRHLIQRDPVEQDLHVEYGINRHTGLPHIAHHPFMVRIVPAVCGQVKGH